MMFQTFLLASFQLHLAWCHSGHHSNSVNLKERNLNEIKEEDPKVLLLSFDGFRADYIYRLRSLTKAANVKNNFDDFIKTSLWAPKGIENVFSTVTFPNHYSMVTGLYQESHGLVGNSIFDPVANRTVHLPGAPNSDYTAHFFGGEPIWLTYAKQRSKFRVACYMWVGCSLPIQEQPVLPTIVPFRPNPSCDDRIDYVVRWFLGGIKLVLQYTDQPDHQGHMTGPESPETDQVLLELNECLGKLIDTLKRKRLYRGLNIILSSDHGMVNLTRTAVLPHNDALFTVRVAHYSHWLVEPRPGKLEETFDYFNNLRSQGIHVYKKEDIPEHWHYKNNARITDILIVGELGVRLSNVTFDPSKSNMTAGHGYNNERPEMRPYFMARGPGLRPKGDVPPRIHTVDLYLLMCRLLKLEPAPNNGSEAVVQAILRHKEENMEVLAHLTKSWIITKHLPFFTSNRQLQESVRPWQSETVVICTAVVAFVLLWGLCYRISSKKQIIRAANRNGFQYTPADQMHSLVSDMSDSEEESHA